MNTIEKVNKAFDRIQIEASKKQGHIREATRHFWNLAELYWPEIRDSIEQLQKENAELKKTKKEEENG